MSLKIITDGTDLYVNINNKHTTDHRDSRNKINLISLSFNPCSGTLLYFLQYPPINLYRFICIFSFSLFFLELRSYKLNIEIAKRLERGRGGRKGAIK